MSRRVMVDQAALERLTKQLADEGKLVEAGWTRQCFLLELQNAPADEVARLRSIFFSGAHYVFTSVLMMLGPDGTPTQADFVRLDKVHDELTTFAAERNQAN